MNVRTLGRLGRVLVAPRTRLLPTLGRRLGRHPRVASAILVGLRRAPGIRLRDAVYRNVSRPLALDMDTRLVVSVSGGSRMIVDLSDMAGQVLATSGVWEPPVTAVFSRLLAPGDICVDVGAHSGYYTLLASRLVGPAGCVYALEPASAAHSALLANLALNSATNVTPVLAAAGASEARARLVKPPERNAGGASIRLFDSTDGGAADFALAADEVVVRPVAAIVEEADRARLALVKIDVEGLEPDVIRGVEPLFASGCRPALVVEVHPGAVASTVTALEHLRSEYGYRAYELVRIPYGHRFAQVPEPRELTDLGELTVLCATRTANVLLRPCAHLLSRRRSGAQ